MVCMHNDGRGGGGVWWQHRVVLLCGVAGVVPVLVPVRVRSWPVL